ncbi:hypothetical protein SKTS_26270 [Sulfurimicrobium lacus]|uniref:Uncharacterized protein n=1 Tax=Sulfurimicrobium lacus TaxID=2715678 RepID=A0A6F8VEY9_9PROT|nr:hypothetical protein [Sulfurimicrobium lacus]BCB27741.1 hypothetical protein SKTS_26270 [Sulfurimicrobium lacus]
MFSFLSRDKPSGIGKRTLKAINDEVIHFLEAREVRHFKVYTIDYENNPVVLIQAEPQKKLRFSNILEVQIKRHLREKLGFQVPAVFWRFKTDTSEEPGPEQADYEFEEKPEYPQDLPAGEQATAAPESVDTTESGTANTSNSGGEHYDVRHLARKGMEVEEISMGEFDEFLKGSAADDSSP